MIDWFVAALRHHAELAFFSPLGSAISLANYTSAVSRSAQ